MHSLLVRILVSRRGGRLDCSETLHVAVECAVRSGNDNFAHIERILDAT